MAPKGWFRMQEKRSKPRKPAPKPSAETRAKMSASAKARWADPEHRRKIVGALKGRKHTAEHRANHAAAMRGKKHTPEARAKMSAAHKGKRMEAAGASWKGDDAQYQAIHLWLRRWNPKTGICDHCGENVGPRGHTGTHFAFKFHGEPYTRNREDYIELCPRCHNRMDAPRRRPRK